MEYVPEASLLKGKEAGGLSTNASLWLAGGCSQCGNFLVHLVYPMHWLSKQMIMGTGRSSVHKGV